MMFQPRSRLLKAAAWTAAFCFFAAAATPVEAEPEMTDQAITDKIEDELFADQAVVSTRVDVDTTNGIATLTGQVDNILAKERAARIAEAVKGVRAVVNRVNVVSAGRSDVQIKRDVEAALLENPATDSYQVTVSVQGGEVTLRGTVDSYQEQELAKTVAKGVRGVRAIDDQVAVDYDVNRPDSEIEREVKQALRWNALVDDYMVDITVNDGEVTLSGTVGSAAEKRLAKGDAWVAGVTSVDASELSVERWARDDELRGDKYVAKSEQELRDAVTDALLYDPRVVSLNVDVHAVGSTVTLRGEVDSLSAKRAAEQDARNTVGVSYVNNRLKVRPDTLVSDSEIADNLRDAFVRDPYVERFDITTTVVDGTAHLYGTVDSQFEKSRADSVASRVAGVLEVRNHLNVQDDEVYLHDPYVDDIYIEDDSLIDFEPRAPTKTDAQIAESIESQMWWSPFVDANEVTVSVDDGVARLTGTVDTWNERRSATENAYEGGATLVDNDLIVNYDHE